MKIYNKLPWFNWVVLKFGRFREYEVGEHFRISLRILRNINVTQRTHNTPTTTSGTIKPTLRKVTNTYKRTPARNPESDEFTQTNSRINTERGTIESNKLTEEIQSDSPQVTNSHGETAPKSTLSHASETRAKIDTKAISLHKRSSRNTVSDVTKSTESDELTQANLQQQHRKRNHKFTTTMPKSMEHTSET
ncbi:11696_t:CDS:2 [Dentiscutata erythropus]|uniref:11696_t:CDS:1 n=1 Tax=Dentiscutata erythropus TaxID=1348616 RepID=A0A9N8W824_9GLOM|nr:11696_t:CDS:2 [Dentiscutata erythropus]